MFFIWPWKFGPEIQVQEKKKQKMNWLDTLIQFMQLQANKHLQLPVIWASLPFSPPEDTVYTRLTRPKNKRVTRWATTRYKWSDKL